MTHYLVRRGFPRPQLCEDCEEAPAVHDATWGAPFDMPSEWLCDTCAERRWDREQERRMEEG